MKLELSWKTERVVDHQLTQHNAKIYRRKSLVTMEHVARKMGKDVNVVKYIENSKKARWDEDLIKRYKRAVDAAAKDLTL